MNEAKVYLNGRIIPADDARVSVRDAGFLHGASVFTTMLARNGVVFRLDRHIERLLAASGKLKLKTSATAEILASGARDVLSANNLANARMRITLTPGSVASSDADAGTVVITADPLADYPSRWYDEGITVIVTSLHQEDATPLAGLKTGCYFPRILAMRQAAEVRADEALWFTPDNRLAEACFCNVFLVLGGIVHTPPLATPVLEGIVRRDVLELCGKLDIPFDDERTLTVKEMLAADEIFLTSSCSGVRPIARIERHAVGNEKPGKVTKKIMDAYKALLEKECGA